MPAAVVQMLLLAGSADCMGCYSLLLPASMALLPWMGWVPACSCLQLFRHLLLLLLQVHWHAAQLLVRPPLLPQPQGVWLAEDGKGGGLLAGVVHRSPGTLGAASPTAVSWCAAHAMLPGSTHLPACLILALEFMPTFPAALLTASPSSSPPLLPLPYGT